ncbi:hypothetical protein ACLOJK_040193 [Asimina triloba]
MDLRLYEASLRGDVAAFKNLMRENASILEQTTPQSSNTALHLVSRCGHLPLAAEMVKLRPQMVATKSDAGETPLHVACREGHAEMLRLLLAADHLAAFKLNRYNQSILYVACSRGHLDVVKHLLGNMWLLLMEEDSPSTSLHAAASGGHTEPVATCPIVAPSHA